MRRSYSKRRWLIVCILTALMTLAGGIVWLNRHDLVRSVERSSLPPAVEYKEVASTNLLPTSQPVSVATSTPSQGAAKTLPAEVNLAVPFTAQAPHANWEDPYGEFCEEASVLMAISYIQGKSIPNPDFANERLLEIKAFEEQRFGYHKDTTAAETAVIFQEFYKYKNVELLENPTANDIRETLAAGKLVVMPAAGRMLGNPYFRPPGPLYHMLVIKGYTADGKFITNDPGTRRGADFVYSEATIMNAIHDWRTDTRIELGEKVVIIVG